jgi:hypothetical protein
MQWGYDHGLLMSGAGKMVYHGCAVYLPICNARLQQPGLREQGLLVL